MTVGELKKSLRRMGGDFDDTHVLIHIIDSSGEKMYDLVTFTGHLTDFSAVVIGGWSVTKRLAEDGKLSPEQMDEVNKLKEAEDKIKRKRKDGDGGQHNPELGS